MSTASTGNEEVQRQIDSIQREFSRLEDQSQFTDVHSVIGRIDEKLAEYPLRVKALEGRGYIHTRPFHEQLEVLQKQWRKAGPQLRLSLREQGNKMKNEVASSSRLVLQAENGRATSIANAEKSLDSLEKKLRAADQVLRSQYGSVDSDLYGLDSALNRAEWVVDQLDDSSEIQLRTGEVPFLAVKSEWHRDGDEGPKGVLFLTDQRLLFEQKEEVVTKKRLGIFKAESEMVQKLWLDINVNDIASIEDSKEGGFLGIGKDDILEITCSGKAPVSRARFHLDGQDSAAWQTDIKRAQSGELAVDRHEPAESKQASQIMSFPNACPNCMAPLPEPHRGATYLTCDFCGTSVGPKEAEAPQ